MCIFDPCSTSSLHFYMLIAIAQCYTQSVTESCSTKHSQPVRFRDGIVSQRAGLLQAHCLVIISALSASYLLILCVPVAM